MKKVLIGMLWLVLLVGSLYVGANLYAQRQCAKYHIADFAYIFPNVYCIQEQTKYIEFPCRYGVCGQALTERYLVPLEWYESLDKKQTPNSDT